LVTKYRDEIPAAAEPRFNPKISNPQLNQKLGPRAPSGQSVPEPNKSQRRSVIGLPSRLERE
jgi:hypothetical protein